MVYKSQFLNIIHQRGFINDGSNLDLLDEELHRHESSHKPFVAYIGFDCTAKSLHIGNLMQIMLLQIFQECGHHPIILLGGGTTKIGDPSGKDKSRQVLSDEEIATNKAGIKKLFAKFLDVEKATFVDNDEWLSSLNLVNFLRDYGRHFSINKMLSMESVKLRLEREQHLSFLEFNYMILQAYDFVELHQKYNCRLQIGGSDQWGNMINGVELARKTGIKQSLFCLTTPLLTNSLGQKMGKTAQGAIWLDEELLPTYDYWQFWRNVEDADVVKFLKFFTKIPMAEIAILQELQGQEINRAKVILANEITRICHGIKAAQNAEERAKAIFATSNVTGNATGNVTGNTAGDTGSNIGGNMGGNMSELLPKIMLDRNIFTAGKISVYTLFKQAGLSKTGAEAKRLIKQGGAKINDEKLQDPLQEITLSDIAQSGIKLSAGKKKHFLVQLKP